MMDTTKSIIAILFVAVIFLSGALAGQYTGMPIAGSSSDLSANTLTVKTLRAPVLFIDINSSIKSYKQLSGIASDRDIAITAFSPSGRGLFGSTESGYGIEGYASRATGFSGFFHGGKGLYADNIVFGRTAFQGSKGQLVLFASGRYRCTGVCSSHGLACTTAYAIESESLTDVGDCSFLSGNKFCICG